MNKFNEGDLIMVARSTRPSSLNAKEGRYGDYYIGDVGVFRDVYAGGTRAVVDFPPRGDSEDRSKYDVDVRELEHATKLSKLLLEVGK